MKELEIEVRVRNNLLKSRRTALGLTQREVASSLGKGGFYYGALEAMSKKPTDKYGRWLDVVIKLAEFFDATPEELFPESLRAIEQVKAVRHVNVVDVPALIGIGDYSARQLESPDVAIGKAQLTKAVDTVLATLTPREEKLLRHRFGLGHDEEPHTLAETGSFEGVDRERARQIGIKTLRKLRHPSRSEMLRDFIETPDDPIISTDDSG